MHGSLPHKCLQQAIRNHFIFLLEVKSEVKLLWITQEALDCHVLKINGEIVEGKSNKQQQDNVNGRDQTCISNTSRIIF